MQMGQDINTLPSFPYFLGYPEPLLAWYKIIKNEITGQKGLRRITNDEKHDIQTITSHGNLLGVSEVWFQLTVINVQAGDYGDYVCEGENKYGNNQAIVNLYGECAQDYFCL